MLYEQHTAGLSSRFINIYTLLVIRSIPQMTTTTKSFFRSKIWFLFLLVVVCDADLSLMNWTSDEYVRILDSITLTVRRVPYCSYLTRAARSGYSWLFANDSLHPSIRPSVRSFFSLVLSAENRDMNVRTSRPLPPVILIQVDCSRTANWMRRRGAAQSVCL